MSHKETTFALCKKYNFSKKSARESRRIDKQDLLKL